MLLSLPGILLMALVLRCFLATHWVIRILAAPLGMWLYFDDKQWRCPRCGKHYGRMIRHLERCPYCDHPLNDKEQA